MLKPKDGYANFFFFPWFHHFLLLGSLKTYCNTLTLTSIEKFQLRESRRLILMDSAWNIVLHFTWNINMPTKVFFFLFDCSTVMFSALGGSKNYRNHPNLQTCLRGASWSTKCLFVQVFGIPSCSENNTKCHHVLAVQCGYKPSGGTFLVIVPSLKFWGTPKVFSIELFLHHRLRLLLLTNGCHNCMVGNLISNHF